MRFIVLICLLFVMPTGCATTQDTGVLAPSEPAVRVLVFSLTSWYRHPEVPKLSGYLAALGYQHGFEMSVSENPKDISAKSLANYDVILFNNTTDIGKAFDDKQKQAIIDWYEKGGGIFGLHAALVHHDTWPWFTELGGCDFNSDSEFLKATVMVDPQAMNHPAVKGFGESFEYTADWTNHTASVTGLPGVQVLLRIDEKSYDPVRDYFKTRGGKPMGEDHPVIWTREHKGGRFFYTELGHDIPSLDTKFGRQHIIEGLRWAAGAKSR